MIYLKVILLLIIVTSVLILFYGLLFLLQKYIYKKSPKLFWLIPGLLIGASLFLIILYTIGKVFNLGCGKNIIILYFGLAILIIISLPSYLASIKLLKS